MKQSTTEGWLNAFGILFFIDGIAWTISGLMYIIFGAIAPAAVFAEPSGRAMAIAAGIIALVAGPLVVLWARGLWERKRWARILMIIAASLGLIIGLLLLVVSIMFLSAPSSIAATLGVTPEESLLAGMVYLPVGIIMLIVSGFTMWLFLRTRDLFTPTRFAWDTETRQRVISGAAVISFVSAVGMAILGVLILVATPFLWGYMRSMVPDIGSTPLLLLLGIGVLLICLGGFVYFVAKALWQRKPWSRIAMLALAWLSAGVAIVNLVLLIGRYSSGIVTIMDLGDGIGQFLTSCVIAGIEIWFFTKAKDLFIGQATQRASKDVPAKTVTPKRKVAKKR